jgi:hypothetical protein
MKKTIRLTESQLTKLIKRVITESSYEKIENIKNNISNTKDSDCWKKGMCPVQHGEGQIVCEFCPSPIAGILIPTIGAIAGAIIGIRNNRERKIREEQEQKWINENPELKDRNFIYFTDGSVQAVRIGTLNDIMIKPKDGTWSKLN